MVPRLFLESDGGRDRRISLGDSWWLDGLILARHRDVVDSDRGTVRRVNHVLPQDRARFCRRDLATICPRKQLFVSKESASNTSLARRDWERMDYVMPCTIWRRRH